MENKGFIQTIDNLGCIIIPKRFRETLNLQANNEVELFLAEDNGKKVLCIRKLK